MTIARAVELARQADGRAYPKPTVGAVVVRDGEVVGEGVTEHGGRHGEVVALDAAGELARGATLYVTLEPCAHWGTTPPCTERVLAGGNRTRRGRLARPESGGRGRAREASRGRGRGGARRLVRGAGPERGLADVGRRSGGRSSPTRSPSRLDGRVALPGATCISGEASRRLVHELRAASDAVAVGMGTVRADAPRPRRARRPDTARAAAPARLRPRAAARRPRSSSCARARSRRSSRRSPARACSRCCSRAARRSQRRSSRPISSTSCSSSSRRCSPGAAASILPRLASPRRLAQRRARLVGEDVLLEAYVHEP